MTVSGAQLSGLLEADSDTAAIQQIQNLGHYPISVVDTKTTDIWSWLSSEALPTRRASQRNLGNATQELAALVQAGLPLDRALAILVELGETNRLRESFTAALASIRRGESLAEALSDNRNFSRFYVNMVHAGERGGNLQGALHRLADYLGRAQALKDSVTAALIYPAIVLVTAALAITVILVFVLPQFEQLFENAGKSLPYSTRMVVALSDIVRQGWWVALAISFAIFLSLRSALRRKSFRLKWDNTKLRIPLFGKLILKFEMELFSRTLGVLLINGVELPSALSITKDTLRNSVIARAIDETTAGLREGEDLSTRLATTNVFPATAIDLIKVGEETGKLAEMLLRQADICERSVKLTVDRMLAMLVPGITIFLGFIVAGLIASILAAVLGVNSLAV